MKTIRMVNLYIGLFVIMLSHSGCMVPLNLPMTSTLNDFVSMNIKTNSDADISFEYRSNVTDGIIKPLEKDRGEEQSIHPGFGHTESTTLGMMLKEYMGNKFAKSSERGKIEVSVLLKDFWIEQYSNDSTGKQAMVVMFGGEMDVISTAKVRAQITIIQNGKETSKIVTSTAQDIYVSGVNTGTSTSFIDRGTSSIEHVHARNINKANNKIIMMLNSFLEENGL